MRVVYIAIYIAFLLGFSGCLRQFDKISGQMPAQVIIKETKTHNYHVVAHGEDIATIAKKYGMKRATLVEINDLKPPYKLFDGQKLVVVQSGYLEPQVAEKHVQRSDISISMGDDIANNIRKKMLDETKYFLPVLGFFEKITKEYSILDPFVTVKCGDGENIFCVADGVVKFAGFLDGDSAQYGKAIIVKHTDLKTISLYCGIDNISINVGENVVRGQIIATAGRTGAGATYPQLKYRIDKIINNGTQSVNPRELIKKY